MIGKYQLWIVVLIGELLWLNASIHRPYDIGDLLFILAIIMVTCATGGVYFFLLKHRND